MTSVFPLPRACLFLTRLLAVLVACMGRIRFSAAAESRSTKLSSLPYCTVASVRRSLAMSVRTNPSHLFRQGCLHDGHNTSRPYCASVLAVQPVAPERREIEGSRYIERERATSILLRQDLGASSLECSLRHTRRPQVHVKASRSWRLSPNVDKARPERSIFLFVVWPLSMLRSSDVDCASIQRSKYVFIVVRLRVLLVVPRASPRVWRWRTYERTHDRERFFAVTFKLV